MLNIFSWFNYLSQAPTTKIHCYFPRSQRVSTAASRSSSFFHILSTILSLPLRILSDLSKNTSRCIIFCYATAIMKSIALRYHSFGKPNEVLQTEEIPLPALGDNQVLLKMKAANINPSDMGQIGGTYGKLKELPATAGREGVGEIIELGKKVTGWTIGQRVRFPENLGTWQSHAVSDATALQAIPDHVSDEQAALAFINPTTAYLLLTSILPLKAGEWIIQNAANSQVGLCVIQLAKKLGLKTVNVVRRAELTEPLKQLGADIVVIEGSDYPKTLKEATGGAKIRLALNSIGGNSATDMIKVLANDGVHVTFGAMTNDAVRFPTRFLIFNSITLRGFWMDKWFREHSKEDIDALMEKVFALIADGSMVSPIAAKYKLSEYKTALESNSAPRLGKVIFVGE